MFLFFFRPHAFNFSIFTSDIFILFRMFPPSVYLCCLKEVHARRSVEFYKYTMSSINFYLSSSAVQYVWLIGYSTHVALIDSERTVKLIESMILSQ